MIEDIVSENVEFLGDIIKIMIFGIYCQKFEWINQTSFFFFKKVSIESTWVKDSLGICT